MMNVLFRAPLAAPMWASQYRSWHPSRPPADLDEQLATLRAMLAEPARRRAVRQTLCAHRDGLDERIERIGQRGAGTLPTLVIMGGADNHFPDPASEARHIGERTGDHVVVVEGAGHYPHAEFPDRVAAAMLAFIEQHTDAPAQVAA